MSKAFEIGKGYTPRDNYIFAFEDGFLTCLKLCLEVAVEKRNIELLKTAEEHLAFFYKFSNSLDDILHKEDLMILTEKEIESINEKYKKVLWEDYKLHEEEYAKIVEEELKNIPVKIENEDKPTDGEDTPCCNEECCDTGVCVEPNWKEECIKLQHELYKAKRTIEGLEYASYNCIPHDDRKPRRDE